MQNWRVLVTRLPYGVCQTVGRTVDVPGGELWCCDRRDETRDRHITRRRVTRIAIAAKIIADDGATVAQSHHRASSLARIVIGERDTRAQSGRFLGPITCVLLLFFSFFDCGVTPNMCTMFVCLLLCTHLFRDAGDDYDLNCPFMIFI